jgi:hypothetical protein
MMEEIAKLEHPQQNAFMPIGRNQMQMDGRCFTRTCNHTNNNTAIPWEKIVRFCDDY